MRKNSVKNIRVNAEVMRVIAEAIRFLKDPRIAPFTSVTDVIVAPDLKTCKVFVSVLGDDTALDKTMEGLHSASGHIRSVVARELNMRKTPELIFLPDQSAAYAIHISRKIDEVIAKDDAAREERGEDLQEQQDANDERMED